MELYVTVSFWINALTLVSNIWNIITERYPETKIITTNFKVAETLIIICIMNWAGFLLFVN